MKIKYYLKGQRYSDNKTKIKAIFKKHGLAWVGSFANPQWANDKERVDAAFARENGVTIGAVLQYSGTTDIGCYKELDAMMRELNARIELVSDEETAKDIEKEVEARIRFWDTLHKPDVFEMRKSTTYRPAAPEAFIEIALNDYHDKREKKLQEIRADIEKELSGGK